MVYPTDPGVPREPVDPGPKFIQEEVYTGILPRRFRQFGFAVLAAAGLLVGFYSFADPKEIALWAGLISTVMGLGSGVASYNTRGRVTRE